MFYVNSSNVTPISLATRTPVANIALPRGARAPYAIAITPDGTTAYVANNGSSNVTPNNLATRTAGAAIALPAGAGAPYAIAITPDGTTPFIANDGSSNVTLG